METATETRSKQDVRKLILSFENLAASSSDAKKPLGSRPGSGDGKGHTASGSGSYTMANHKQTSAYSPLRGGRYFDMSQFSPYPNGEGTVPYTTFGLMQRSEGPDPDDVSAFFDIKESKKSVLCDTCSEEHPPYSPCPFSVPCNVCYNFHIGINCPYFHRIPQGAAFDSDKYEIVCCCGNVFDAEKWVCIICSGRSPLLKKKYCAICSSFAKHCSYECPKDTAAAAKYKSGRDHYLAGRSRPI